jgi:hypothetical protein
VTSRSLRILLAATATLGLIATTVTVPTPRASAATLSLTFEDGTAGRIVLGDLASRSQSKPISVGGSDGVYTVIGTDSRTGELYSYLTDMPYQEGDPGEQRESDERSTDGFDYDRSITTYEDIEGTSRADVLYLYSDGDCQEIPDGGTAENTLDGVETYCSVFGPEVWTGAFNASSGQALAFDYAAEAGDNYEIYAFLVTVTCSDPSDLTTCDYGGGKGENATDPLDTHTLFLHRRGERLAWSTASGAVPGTGTYRFRFVDGAFDQSGGQALGTDFYIDPASLVLGAAQTITFPQPADVVIGDGTTTISASASSGLTTTVASLTTGICTIDGGTVTLVATGTCVLRANAAGGEASGTTYVAASTVVRSFAVLAARTAPVNNGAPAISGSAVTGRTLTAIDGTWGDGASTITDTSYQWIATVDGEATEIAGATASTLVLPCSLEGAEISVRVTKTNGEGSTSATSARTVAVTLGTCPGEGAAETTGPTSSPVPDPGGDLPTATPPGSTSGSVDGVPAAPTPSVPTSGTAKYEVGVVQAEVRTGGAGTVSGPSSAPVLQVVRDRVATVGGGGMAPGGIVEVWMPLPGGGSRQVALLPVAPDGTFDGALPFTGELDGRGPLPIGERTIQLFGTDANGQLTVINVGIRVQQPGPLAPEPERTPGAPPSLAPGQSLATNAGIPTPVTVTPQPGSRRVGVAGDGWLLEIDVPEGTVRDEAGNPIMEIITGDDTEVRGTGFMPGTRAYVWIMSTPTFLGEVTVRSDGSFAGDLPVDVAPGQHTLQVSGVGTDGYIRAANLGVIVLAGDGSPRPNRVRAGEGTAPLLPLETGALALSLAAGLAAADRTRRRSRSTAD